MEDRPTNAVRPASPTIRPDIFKLLAEIPVAINGVASEWPTDSAKALKAANHLSALTEELRDSIVVASRGCDQSQGLTWGQIGEALGIPGAEAFAKYGLSWGKIREERRERGTKPSAAARGGRETFPWWSLQEAADVCGVSTATMFRRGGGKTELDENGAPRPTNKTAPGVKVAFHTRRSGNYVARYMVDQSLVVNRNAIPERDRHRFPGLFPEEAAA